MVIWLLDCIVNIIRMHEMQFESKIKKRKIKKIHIGVMKYGLLVLSDIPGNWALNSIKNSKLAVEPIFFV